MRAKLTDLADVIRSKNAGPYELTFDILFKTSEIFDKVCASGEINEKRVCELFRVTPDKVVGIIAFKPANAIKITIQRPISSGDLGETDVYGAQQHAPLLGLEFDL